MGASLCGVVHDDFMSASPRNEDCPPAGSCSSSTPVEVLHRWELSGGVWRVAARSPSALTVALMTCDGGQEVQRLTSADPDLYAFVGDRVTNAP